MKERTVGKAAEIDQEATRVFCKALPSSWLDRKQDPDYHIDYVVELVDAGELTGKNFGSQVKGCAPAPGKPVRLKYSLSTKHLAYYVDKVEYPVFLFLVNTATGDVFFRFMQRFAQQLPAGWRAQKSVTVEFDSQDNFANQLRFTNVLVDAARFTRDLHPGSVEAALSDLKKKIETIDPRMDVRIDVVKGKNHFFLKAKEDVSFSIQLTNPTPEKTAAFVNFVEKGDDLIVKASEVRFQNAPIFEKMMEGEIRITHRAEVPGHISLSAPAGQAPFNLQVPAVFWSGTKYMSMRAGYDESPFQFESAFQPELWTKDHPFTCELKIEWDKWKGKAVTALPYFDHAHELVAVFANRPKVDVKFVIKGNDYGRAAFETGGWQGFKKLFSLLELVRKIREICIRLGASANLPDLSGISRDDFRVAGELYAVLFEGSYVRKIPKGTLTGQFEDNGTVAEPDAKLGPLKVIHPKPLYRMWDAEFWPGPIESEYTEMRLLSFKRLVEEKAIEIKWRGTAGSVETTKLQIPT